MNIESNLIGEKVRTNYKQQVPDYVRAVFLDHAHVPKALIQKGVGDGYIQEVFIHSLMPWKEVERDGER